MKLLLIGGLVGLVIGVALTVLYFSLAVFFEVNAKALNTTRRAAENVEKKQDAKDVTAIDKRKAG